jgi:hypothetical protein
MRSSTWPPQLAPSRPGRAAAPDAGRVAAAIGQLHLVVGAKLSLVWATDIAEAFSDFKLIPIWGSDSTDRITDHYDLWSY